VADRATMT